MRSALIVVCVFIFTAKSFAQNSFNAVVKDSDSGKPLIGATAVIKGTSTGGSSDTNGQIRIQDIPDGEHTIEFSFLGYRSQPLKIMFPYTGQPALILLEAKEEELEEIVITSTRSSRTIADIPTRVEFIAGEELDEKANMKPGDIRMLLSESTGIQTQQTSPTSANASIRIQGLDGRYTQILKVGFRCTPVFLEDSGCFRHRHLILNRLKSLKGLLQHYMAEARLQVW